MKSGLGVGWGAASVGLRAAICFSMPEFRNSKSEAESLIPLHGGYRHLRSFQVAQLAFDVTVRFADRYINPRSRTHDQMVQAARSGVQNIAEGSKASGTSKKMELKLTNVARASLEELKLDYEDFLRQRGLALWPEMDPRRRALVARRCRTADEVAEWVKEVKNGLDGRNGQNGRNRWRKTGGRGGDVGQSLVSISSMKSMPSIGYAEIAANAAHVLIGVACALLDRQIEAQAAAFEREGGFTERLYRVRSGRTGRR